MKKLCFLLVLLFTLALLAGACAPQTTKVISQDQALTIAQERFTEYLEKHPEMSVKDPVYTVTKKTNSDDSQYWSVQIELQEEAYAIYYYEVMISPNGKKITLATG